MTWRLRAAPVIRRVLEETRGQSEEAITRALFEAYPFGPREYHPYKVWLDEIKRQRGAKPKFGPCRCGHGHGTHRGRCHAADCTCTEYEMGNPDQLELTA
jgi:hypothetical protein